MTSTDSPRAPLTEPELLDVIRAYKAGESIATLARRYGCSKQTIRRWLIKLGVERRHAGRPTALPADAIERLRAEARS